MTTLVYPSQHPFVNSFSIDESRRVSRRDEEIATAEYLSDYSPQDAPWDIHRAQAQEVEAIYGATDEFFRYSERIFTCSTVLWYAWATNADTGESAIKLRDTHFCRVRHCPVCQWRRSLMWRARFYKAIPKILEAHPKARWVMLTLTVRNCDIRELRKTLSRMNKAWRLLTLRKEFKPVLGWIRATEVTRGKDDSAHPHFHTLMLVPPGWFSKYYVKQSRWAEIWGECLQVDYTPVVDVRAVKSKAAPSKEKEEDGIPQELKDAVPEVLKYATKPEQLLKDAQENPEWFLELTRQVHHLRFIATGGVLKNVLRENEETEEDLLLLEEGEASGGDQGQIAFSWGRGIKRYARDEELDRLPE